MSSLLIIVLLLLQHLFPTSSINKLHLNDNQQQQQQQQHRQLFSKPETISTSLLTNKKYFLSVMMMELNEVKGILEFMQHYIEEGVDHVYIYDDGSTDGTIEALHECVPKKYYTIFTSKDIFPLEYFRNQTGEGKTQNEGFYEMYGRLGLKDSSEWVIVIDADELITSRTHPNLSIKDIIIKKYSTCDVISVPWLIFIWGEHKVTIANSARYRLFDRWGFDSKFAVGRNDGKFRNVNESNFVKAIVKTDAVPMIYKNHRADFRANLSDTSHPIGTVCISHAEKHLKCLKKLTTNATNEQKKFVKSLYDVPQNFIGGYQRDAKKKKVPLPPYCLHQNRLRATMSPAEIMMFEDDVDLLDLALFHYRVKSLQDWERMLDPTRFTGFLYEEYRKKMHEVNRMDIVDDFMVSQRLSARKDHPDFVKARKIFEHCPAKYYL